MERFEKELQAGLKQDSLDYPDFEQMWTSIQQGELKNPAAMKQPKKRWLVPIGLAAALMVTPAYAAVTYDWSTLLTQRAGIQAALEQGLGQQIAQSVTNDGVTITLHNAFMDDNRTFLLFQLQAPKASAVEVERIGFQTSDGQFITGDYFLSWNDELALYEGYFETDWVAKQSTTTLEFIVENIRLLQQKAVPLDFNLNNPNAQSFAVAQDSIVQVTVQAIKEQETMVLHSTITMLNDSETKNIAYVEVLGDKQVPIPTQSAVMGTPLQEATYTNKQVYDKQAFLQAHNQFQLTYAQPQTILENSWQFHLQLQKKQLEKSMISNKLNVDLAAFEVSATIEEMIVTPSQVKLIIAHDKYKRLPYMNYALAVGDTTLEGGMWDTENPKKSELRFELAGVNVTDLATKPVTLIATHRVDIVEGDDTPIVLEAISSTPKSMTTQLDGYNIVWTYYQQGEKLYVQSASEHPEFGGVTQTYYVADNEKHYGEPQIFGVMGGASNVRMDVYNNVNATTMTLYILNYTKHDRTAELRVLLPLEN